MRVRVDQTAKGRDMVECPDGLVNGARGGDGMVARVDEEPVASGKQGKGRSSTCHQEGDQARSKTKKNERQTGRKRERETPIPGVTPMNMHNKA